MAGADEIGGKIMSEEMKNRKINDEELNNVSGGLIFNAQNILGADPNRHFEVLDWRGDVCYRGVDYADAYNFAVNNGFNPEYTEDWNRIVDLRNRTH